MQEKVRARGARATGALLLTLASALLCALAFAALCSGAAPAAQVGARHQAEGMTDLGSPDWATVAGDETGDDGTHVRFKEIADGADRLRFTATTAQPVDEIRFRARLSPAGAGDDRLAVWVDGVKRGSVLPPAQQTMATQALPLATPIAAGSHTVEVGPGQRNDAFVAFDWLELPNTGVASPPPDQDGDGVPDSSDNCQAVANAGQSDADDDGIGDACDGPGKRDSDGDGVADADDNCQDAPNPDQTDTDAAHMGGMHADGLGDACDTDDDGDSVLDADDDCDLEMGPASNAGCPKQAPTEIVGNQDGDAFDDFVDLCPGTASASNLDSDSDKIGNACDPAPSTPVRDTGADQMRIKTNGCKVNAVNRVDPIAYSAHLHRQFGNRSTTNESTGAQLKANASTSCAAESDWFTSAAWFPVEGNAAGAYQEDVKGISTYYRALGNQAQVKPIPTGLQLLATEEKYNCTASGEGTFEETPPYGCNTNWTTRVIFPDCWNMQSKEEDTVVYSGRKGACPSTHPYRIPQVSFLIMHDNPDGFIPNPLHVSSGEDQTSGWPAMHADYFAALQDEFGKDTAEGQNLVDLCLRNANDGADVAHPRCGEGP